VSETLPCLGSDGKALRSILHTESDPQLLHRPWVSNAICVMQLTHNQCFMIA
jgi:hypothetical protein